MPDPIAVYTDLFGKIDVICAIQQINRDAKARVTGDPQSDLDDLDACTIEWLTEVEIPLEDIRAKMVELQTIEDAK